MVFTKAGRNVVRDWLAGDSATAPNAIAVGTGSTAATNDDTALIAEVFKETASASKSPFLIQYEMIMDTLDATGNTLAEYGLFNNTATTTGTMFTRNTFAPISKTSSIEIQFEQRVEIE